MKNWYKIITSFSLDKPSSGTIIHLDINVVLVPDEEAFSKRQNKTAA